MARRLDDGRTLEITRVCSRGERNVNSFLYARVARIAKVMGYRSVITYSLEKESGASLRAVGARVAGRVEPQEWSVPSRARRNQAVYGKRSGGGSCDLGQTGHVALRGVPVGYGMTCRCGSSSTGQDASRL